MVAKFQNCPSESLQHRNIQLYCTSSHSFIPRIPLNSLTKLNTSTEPEILGFSNKVSATGPFKATPIGQRNLGSTIQNTQTWEYYKLLRPIVGNSLPTMAISKVKTDKNGTPNRAKYRIVVLGKPRSTQLE